MDIVAALSAKPPHAAGREIEAPKRRAEDDSGRSRERFDEALDNAAATSSKESEEPRASKTRKQDKSSSPPADSAETDRGIDGETLKSAIAGEDFAETPGDLGQPVIAEAPVIEIKPAPETEPAGEAKPAAAEIVSEVAPALAPAPEQPATSVEQTTPDDAAPAATAAFTAPGLERAGGTRDGLAIADRAEQLKEEAAKQDKAQRSLDTALRTADTAPPVIAKQASAEIEKPAPNAVALAQALELSLTDARAAEPQLGAGLASIPDLAGKLKLAASPSALQQASEKSDLLAPASQIGLTGERIALSQDLSASALSSAAAKLEVHQPSPAASADAARQVIAAIRTGAGGDGVEVRLDPPDLGRVRIHFTMDRADSVTAVVTSDRSDTLDMMRRHSADLAKELARAGFTDVHMEFKSGGGDRPQQNAALEPTGARALIDDEPLETTHVVYTRASFDGRLDRLV